MKRTALVLVAAGFCQGIQFNKFSADKCTSDQACFPTDREIREFALTLKGGIAMMLDAEYNKLLDMNNMMFTARPAFVATPKTDEDVVKAVAFAKKKNMRLSVRGGGHAYDGQNAQDDAVHLNMKHFNRRDVTSVGEASFIRVGVGLEFTDIYAAVYDHNLIFNGGSCPTVGVGGWIQGGGTSGINRMVGLGVDSVLEMKVVLIEEEKVVTISAASQHADLFFALLGGGGGTFAVALEYKIRLHVPPTSLAALSLDYVWSTPDMPDCGRSAIEYFMSLQDEITDKWGIYVVVSSLPHDHFGNQNSDVPVRIASYQNRWHRSMPKQKVLLQQSRGLSFDHNHTGILTFHGLHYGPIDEARASIQKLLDFRPECTLSAIDKLGDVLPTLEPKATFEDYQSAISCSRGGGLGCGDRITNKPLLVTEKMLTPAFYDLLSNVAEFVGNDEHEGIGFMWTALGGAVQKYSATTSVSRGFRTAFGNAAFNGYWIDEARNSFFTHLSRDFGRRMYALAGKDANMYVNYPDTDGLSDWQYRYFGDKYDRLVKVKEKYDRKNFLLKYQGIGWEAVNRTSQDARDEL
ncbi:FAD-linked oxidoreductase easE [Diplonema papillatum]|nr:FAD-linked oxidoreductase easE [Diplonema papillatum]